MKKFTQYSIAISFALAGLLSGVPAFAYGYSTRSGYGYQAGYSYGGYSNYGYSAPAYKAPTRPSYTPTYSNQPTYSGYGYGYSTYRY